MFGYMGRRSGPSRVLSYIIIILTMPRHNDSMTFAIIIKRSIVQISCRVFSINEMRLWRCRIALIFSRTLFSLDDDFISSNRAEQRAEELWESCDFIIITSAKLCPRIVREKISATTSISQQALNFFLFFAPQFISSVSLFFFFFIILLDFPLFFLTLSYPHLHILTLNVRVVRTTPWRNFPTYFTPDIQQTRQTRDISTKFDSTVWPASFAFHFNPTDWTFNAKKLWDKWKITIGNL